jgi:hypothetical protein
MFHSIEELPAARRAMRYQAVVLDNPDRVALALIAPGFQVGNAPVQRLEARQVLDLNSPSVPVL